MVQHRRFGTDISGNTRCDRSSLLGERSRIIALRARGVPVEPMEQFGCSKSAIMIRSEVGALLYSLVMRGSYSIGSYA